MAGWIELDTIAPGTLVFDTNGRPFGTVEAIEGQALRVGGRAVPGTAIARADPSGIFLRPEAMWDEVDTGSGGAAPIAGDDTLRDRPLPILEGAATADAAGAPIAPAAPQIIEREEGRIVIPLAEERPTVTDRPVDLGEIIVVKRVIDEERMVPVTVRREIVERVTRAADGTERVEELSARILSDPSDAANER
jgi:hypothetical protein